MSEDEWSDELTTFMHAAACWVDAMSGPPYSSAPRSLALYEAVNAWRQTEGAPSANAIHDVVSVARGYVNAQRQLPISSEFPVDAALEQALITYEASR